MTRRSCIFLFVLTYLLGCVLAAMDTKGSPIDVMQATMSAWSASNREAIADASQRRRDEIERSNAIRESRPLAGL